MEPIELALLGLVVLMVLFFISAIAQSDGESSIDWTAQYVYENYDPDSIRPVLERLYSAQEYETELRQTGQDGHLDLLVNKPSSSYNIGVVFVERDPDNPRSVVGKNQISMARDSAQTVGADSVHVVTPSEFSENAEVESSRGGSSSLSMQLFDGDRLASKLNEFEVSP